MRAFKVPFWFFLLGPSILFILGAASNALVIWSNGGYMPVSGAVECVFHAADERVGDVIHVCMDAHTKLKWLADWIYYPPFGTMSVGDVCEIFYQQLAFPFWVLWAGLMVYKENR